MYTDVDMAEYDNASGRNVETLMRILRDNSETELGRKHGFSELNDADMYRERVPLSSYGDYERCIDRMMSGEENILTSYPVRSYCYTSGTSSSGRKLFPITEEQLKIYDNRIDGYADKELKKLGGKRFFPQTFRALPGKRGDITIITELLHQYKAECGGINYDDYVGGEELMFDEDVGDAFFAKCYAALSHSDISIMESVYFYDHLHFFSYLEKNYERVIKAMRTGVIPDDIHLSESMRSVLKSIKPDSDRVDHCLGEMRRGFKGIAGRLWPKLSLMTGISTRAFFAENNMINYYAPEISCYYNYYMATELYMGDCVKTDDFDYVLLPGNGFYEFIPYGSNASNKTLLPHELKKGRMYEPVITSFSGLYRYRMGDVLLVKGNIGESPLFEFVRRRGVAISIAGERTAVTEIEESMRRISMEGADIGLYCFAPCVDKESARYRLAVVTGSGQGKDQEDASSLNGEMTSSSKEVWDEHRLSARVDEILRELNAGYNDLRGLKYLSEPEVRIFGSDDYFDFMNSNGLLDGNKKPKHISVSEFKVW